MKTLVGFVLIISAFLLISAGDANAGGYYYSGGHGCYPSYPSYGFSFGFYGGSFYPPYIPYSYYSPYYSYRPYYGYHSPYYGGYGYYGRRHYYGGHGYYGRYSRYSRPYSYRSYRRYPRIQKPYSYRDSGSRVVRRRY